MSGDDTSSTGKDTSRDPEAPDANLDPAGLRGALGRTGRMLKTAGLPFEEDEFDDADAATGRDEADADSTSQSSEGEDTADDPSDASEG